MFFTHVRSPVRWLAAGLALTLAAQVQAGIVLNTTRIIYPAADREATITVHNTGTADILAQSWLETQGDASAQQDPPFAVTPALTRMAGNARQLIRMIYAGEGLPDDRESVLWLNVQEIPQAVDVNTLQVAIRQRVKLFYRPRALVEDPAKAAQSLQWKVSGTQLEVSNPGPYHVSMVVLQVRQHGRSLLRTEGQMLAPHERLQLPLNQWVKGKPVELTFTSINDYGAQEFHQAMVSDQQVVTASKAEPGE